MEGKKVVVMLTGFGPFGCVEKNPTSDLVDAVLADEAIKTKPWVLGCAQILETSVQGTDAKMAEIQASCSKSYRNSVLLHIHLGVHGGAKSFRLEQRGFNCDNFRIPDVRGVQICNKKIDPSLALDAFESSINVQLLTSKLCEKTKSDQFIESKDPGRFLCNHAYFNSLRFCHRSHETSKMDSGVADLGLEHHSLFVHVPPVSQITIDRQYLLLIALLDTLSQQFLGSFRKTPGPLPLMDTTAFTEKYAPSVRRSHRDSSMSALGSPKCSALFGRQVVLPDGEVLNEGHVVFDESGEITAVAAGWPSEAEFGDAVVCLNRSSPAEWIVPGFVDIHCHGLGGASDVLDYWSYPNYSLEKLAGEGGTTSVVATLTFPDPPLLKRTLEAARVLNSIYQKPGLGARVEGIHAEGPIIATRGGLPDSKLQIAWPLQKFTDLLDTLTPALKIMTISPSLEQWDSTLVTEDAMDECFTCGTDRSISNEEHHQDEALPRSSVSAFARIDALMDRNILASLGHDKFCTEENIMGALSSAGERGTRLHLTHAFNVQEFHHRRTGLSNIALLGQQFPSCVQRNYPLALVPTVEVIGDLCHVSPITLQILLNAKQHGVNGDLAFITDAIADSTCPGKELTYGETRKAYVAHDGRTVTDENYVLCGSCTTLYQIFLSLVREIDVPVHHAVRMCSENPAKIAKLNDRVGSLRRGMLADILVLDKDLAIRAVYVQGKEWARCENKN